MRDSRAYRKWRRCIYSRANGKCEVSGGYLLSVLSLASIAPEVRLKVLFSKQKDRHHLYDYSSYKRMRTKTSNGILISKPIHDHFHKIFGKNKITPAHFILYLFAFFPLSAPIVTVKIIWRFLK